MASKTPASIAIDPPQANSVFRGKSNAGPGSSRYPYWIPIPAKFIPPPAEFNFFPSQDRIFDVVA